VCFDAGSPEADGYKDAWFSVKEQLYTPQNPMMNLPWVKCEWITEKEDGDVDSVDGSSSSSSSSSLMVVQTNACLYFLGREFGLAGDSDNDDDVRSITKARIDQVVAQTMDWRNSSIRHFYSKVIAAHFGRYY
jgi:hypothetical protein